VAAVVKPQANYFGGETRSKKPDLVQFISTTIQCRWATKAFKVGKRAASDSSYDVLG
jgi:hypothetical protein